MKFAIPEISWHNRDPVLSADFQPKADSHEPLRLATGGTDSHVLIWYISTTTSGSVNLEVAADLTRHQKAVNIVRWSPNGQYLASGDDESIIFIWQQKTEKETIPIPTLEGEEQYKESWVVYKTLRGHMEDVLDISWSANSAQLASGSVDNKLLMWDVSRGRYSNILTDHKGFVQGVSWDPKGQYIVSASTDRMFRTFDVATKKVVSRSSKATLPFPADHPFHNTRVRLYHDDTLQTFYRRLQFSPDGLLIAVPAGKVEPEQGKVEGKPINAVYIYTRYSLKVPVCILPSGEPALVTRWSPRTYALRTDGPKPAFPNPSPGHNPSPRAPSRMVLAVGTKRSVLLYDTQQRTPIALISNIHYTRLTDLTWSPDGRTLVASSTDGFCSVITFTDGELGEVLPEEVHVEQTVTVTEPMELQTEDHPEVKDKAEETKPTTPKINSYMKFKTPSEKSPKKQKTEIQQRTPIKSDVLEDAAMPSWSDNSNSEMMKSKCDSMDVVKSEIMIIEDSEDMVLVYDETETNLSPKSADKKSPISTETNISPKQDIAKATVSPKAEDSNFLKQAKVTDIKESAAVAMPSPKAPRRVNFVTLSSPKNKKKL